MEKFWFFKAKAEISRFFFPIYDFFHRKKDQSQTESLQNSSNPTVSKKKYLSV